MNNDTWHYHSTLTHGLTLVRTGQSTAHNMGRRAQFELSHLDGSSLHPIMIPLLGGRLAKATVIPLFGWVSPLWFSPSTVSTMITSFNGPIYIVQWWHYSMDPFTSFNDYIIRLAKATWYWWLTLSPLTLVQLCWAA